MTYDSLCAQTFTMSGNKMYQATIQTGNDEHGLHSSLLQQQVTDLIIVHPWTAGTTGAIELTMTGTYRQASPKMLLEGVRPGAEEHVAFRSADGKDNVYSEERGQGADTLETAVGEIESLLLHNSAVEDPWFCESVRISADSGSVTSFTVKRWIGSPFQPAVTVTLRPSLDTDMAPKNLEIFKVRCPMNCAGAEFALSEGASIHPGTSAVCAAAELDGVTSASVFINKEQRTESLLPVAAWNCVEAECGEVYGQSDKCLFLPLYNFQLSRSKQGDFMVFTEDSARKACQELGYLHGMYHEDGCSNLYGHNVCAGPRYPIAAAGPEKSIHDCTFEEPTPQCRNHSFDVAVKCSNNPPAEPVFGTLRIVDEEGSPVMDGTGRLQVYKTDVNGINVCGLDSEPIHMVNVACEGDEKNLRNCPHETKADIYCSHSEDIVVSCRGDGDSTGMCKAAIHAGAMGKNGGEIAVILGQGQRSYWGSSRNGIPSESAEAQSASVNDVKARSDKEDKPKMPKSYAGESALRGLQQRMQQVEQQTAPLLIPPKFQWGVPHDFAGFRGKGGDFVDLKELPGSSGMSGFSDFSIAVHASVKGGKGHWRTIVSHSGCGGLLLAVDESGEIVLEHNCNPQTISTGITPAIDEKFHLTVTFFSPDKRIAVYYNGEKAVSELTEFDFNIKASGMLLTSCLYTSDTDYFVGTISSLQVFNYVLSPEQVRFLSLQAPEVAGASELTPGGERRTQDGRVCFTACSPEEPFLQGEEAWLHPTNPSINLTCTDTGWLPAFNGFTDSRFLIACPEDCHKAKAPLKGSKVYTPDTSVCKAALHAGVLGLEGGEAVLVVHNGISNYTSSKGQHGNDGELEPQMRSFSVIHAPPFKRLSCFSDGSFVLYMQVDELALVACPAGCMDASEARVYGTKLYSPMSSVCRAAIHAGALSPVGGARIAKKKR
ncbi:hypothetical protein Esti_005226 [Eimeria stiedai]